MRVESVESPSAQLAWRPDADEPAPLGEHPQHQAGVVAGIPRPFVKPDDETVTLYADGRAVERPVVLSLRGRRPVCRACGCP
jgi:hypothetical protein